MPTLVWRYLTALRYDRPSANGVALAEALATISHDRLTRLRQGDWSGQTLLALAVRTLVSWERGSLIIDATVMPKSFATVIEGLAWVFSRQEHQPVDGLSLVLRVWTNGTLRIPLGMRLWRTGGRSQYALALAWLSDATHRLTLVAPEVRRLYRWRAQIEAVMRVCTEQRGLSGGQARSIRTQPHPISGCLAACCVLERERHDRHLSISQRKRLLRFQGRSVALPALERLRTAAYCLKYSWNGQQPCYGMGGHS